MVGVNVVSGGQCDHGYIQLVAGNKYNNPHISRSLSCWFLDSDSESI